MRAVLGAVDSPANGVTFCTGSFGARPDNDLPAMFRRFADRVHFVHLRNVKRQSPDVRGSFYEAEHLGGDTDMVAVIAEIVAEERRAQGRRPRRCLDPVPPRPRAGHPRRPEEEGQPGYPAIGRLKGLAELRGIMTALTHPPTGCRHDPAQVALVGVGKIARDQHIPAIAADPDFTLAAGVSRHATIDGVPNFPDLDAFLAEGPRGRRRPLRPARGRAPRWR